MTIYNPFLILERLVVLRNGKPLYDHNFHEGVNIIRGRNSSGKSTISDFIFYALGGDIPSWKPEASKADYVFAQIKINGAILTLLRSVESSGMPPMDIYEGTYEEGIKEKDKWFRYPSSRSANSESFSQVLFKYLGFPEQKTQSDHNITMHQILRLLYGDQLSNVEHIFRDQKRGDLNDTRVAIADLLLGLDNFEVHELTLKLRNAEKKFAVLHSELKSLFSFLGKTDDSSISILEYSSRIKDLKEEREKYIATIDEIKRQETNVDVKNTEERELEQKIEDLKSKRANLLNKQQEIAYEINDSFLFVKSLKERLEAVAESMKLSNIIGMIDVEYCPVCLAEIVEPPNDENCNLCKTKYAKPRHASGHLRMRDELLFQIRESEKISTLSENRLYEITYELEKGDVLLETLEEKYAQYVKNANPLDAELSNLYIKIGYTDRNIEDLNEKRDVAELIERMISEKSEFNSKINLLKDKIEVYNTQRAKRREYIQYKISDQVVALLHEDLNYEEAFATAEKLEFDFGANKLILDGRSSFSASSMIFLKNVFLFSLFLLSLEDPDVRIPRFIILDNLEDKGTEPERSANLQNIIIGHSEGSKILHQIIITTSMIDPDLENSEYCIGPHYDDNNKSLAYI